LTEGEIKRERERERERERKRERYIEYVPNGCLSDCLAERKQREKREIQFWN
jgi:hypothetical protein